MFYRHKNEDSYVDSLKFVTSLNVPSWYAETIECWRSLVCWYNPKEKNWSANLNTTI